MSTDRHRAFIRCIPFPICTWLVSNISPISSGRIEIDRLYEDYKQACTHAKEDYFTKGVFSKFIIQIFPYSKISRIKRCGERIRQYVGIDKATPTQSSSLFLTEIENHLDEECVLLSKSLVDAKIGVMSNITANGNRVIKEITLNFILKTWNLEVRGVTINLKTLGLLPEFDLTLRSWRNILYVVKRIRLCKGLVVSDKKTIPIHITAEVIEDESKDDQISSRYMRCSGCLGVVSWIFTGNACNRCRKLLNSFKNTDQTQQSKLINLGESIDRDGLT